MNTTKVIEARKTELAKMDESAFDYAISIGMSEAEADAYAKRRVRASRNINPLRKELDF
jgi:hypothetical protein